MHHIVNLLLERFRDHRLRSGVRLDMLKRPSLTALLFLVAAIDIASAQCPAYTSTRLDLPSGSVSFREYYRTGRSCRWSVPTNKALNHVVLLKLTSNFLRKRGCVGQLELSNVGSFCNKPTNSCFIYASLPTCNRQMTFDLMRNENCSESYWILNSDSQRYIRFYSHTTTWKSFSFDYKYFSCEEYLNRTQSFSSEEENQDQALISGVSSGTFAGVIALFLILLLASLALLFLLYRRFRKLECESKPRRVQYELSKPTGVISGPLNAENANDSASRESNFALHGEHHSTYLHQANDTSYHEATVGCSYGAAVDYGADNNQGYLTTANLTHQQTNDPSYQEATGECNYGAAADYSVGDNQGRPTTLNLIHQTNDTPCQEATAGCSYDAADVNYRAGDSHVHPTTVNLPNHIDDTSCQGTTSRRGYIAMAPLPATTPYQEAEPRCNYDYSADADYRVDVNQDYSSFTSDESDQHPTVNDQACAYAVVNKERQPPHDQ